MEIPTPEQLKQEKAERDSVLAELLLSERKNKDLTAENNRLTKSIDSLTSIEGDLKIKIEARTKLLTDVKTIQGNIVALTAREKVLSETILRAENDIGNQSWVGHRDRLLKIVGDLKTAQEELEKKNIELGQSNAEIEARISKAQGRMEEMDKSEEAYKNVVSIEVAELMTKKSTLEVEVEKEKLEVESLTSKKETLLEAITTLTDIYDKVFANVHEMEGIVGSVKEVSDKNISELRELFAEMGGKIKEVIEKGQESADGANVILEKLPRWIFELQRPHSLKRVRPERLVDRRTADQLTEEEKNKK